MKQEKLFYLLTILTIVFTIIGGSFAYWSWQSTNAQVTSVTFTVGSNFSCSADGGGNITNNVYFVPTDCTNSTYAIQREITTTITNSGEDDVYLQMWLTINSIGSGLSNSQNFKWALTTDSTSCTTDVVNSGNFNGKVANDKIGLLSNVTEGDTYYLYIWLDSAETNSSTMNQSVSLSLGGECSNQEPNKVYFSLYDSIYDEEFDAYDTLDRIADYRFNIRSVSTASSINVPNGAITFNLGDTNYSNEDDVVGWLENMVEDEWGMVTYDFKFAPKSGSKLYAKDLSYAFRDMYVVRTVNLTGLNTSEVTNMFDAFHLDYTGEVLGKCTNIILGNDFDTSNVTNMSGMFADNPRLSNLNLGSKFNTINVTDMSYMFGSYGIRVNDVNLDLGNNFDTSNVTDMSWMFSHMGHYANNLFINLGNKFDTSNVTDMSSMFLYIGYNATNFDLNLGNHFDTSNVTDMHSTFRNAGHSAQTNFSLDLSAGNFVNITNYQDMFYGVPSDKVTIYVKDSTARTWITSKNSDWGTSFSASNVLVK